MTRQTILGLIGCSALAACSVDEAPEFCRDHVLFHAEHAASTVKAAVSMSSDGRLVSEFEFPVATFGQPSTLEMLKDASSVYSVATTGECSSSQATVESSEDTIVATYTSDCGPDNKIGQLDILLFESLPDLDEVDVTVVTPATQKRFAIHRQCDSAIFRFR